MALGHIDIIAYADIGGYFDVSLVTGFDLLTEEVTPVQARVYALRKLRGVIVDKTESRKACEGDALHMASLKRLRIPVGIEFRSQAFYVPVDVEIEADLSKRCGGSVC